jgi:hypothetical protein
MKKKYLRVKAVNAIIACKDRKEALRRTEGKLLGVDILDRHFSKTSRDTAGRYGIDLHMEVGEVMAAEAIDKQIDNLSWRSYLAAYNKLELDPSFGGQV